MDENGNKVLDKELYKSALDLISEACCLLYEIETTEGRYAAFMADAALRCAHAAMDDHDPRDTDNEFKDLKSD